MIVVFGIALSVLLSPADNLSEPDITRIPHCAATAAFTIVRMEGIQASLSNVAARFPIPEARTASLSELTKVLDSFGVQTTAIRIQPKSLSDLQVPIVLYFEPGRWPRSGNVGHFLTLIRQDKDSVTVLDWNQLIVETRLPRRAVEDAWSGTAIVLNRSLPLTPLKTTMLLFVLIGMAFFLTWRKWPFGTPRTHSLCFLFLPICTLIGCNRNTSTTAPTASPLLTCDYPLVDLGEVDGSRQLESQFAIHVSAAHSVKITSIVKSCGCSSAEDDLIGKSLGPGSNHSLKVNVRPDGDEGGDSIIRIFTLATDPPSVTPVTLAVKYRRRSRPQISVSQLVIETSPAQPAKAIIHITHRRGEFDPSIPVVAEKFSSPDFCLTSHEMKTELVNRGLGSDSGNLAFDRTEIQLVAREHRGYGDYRGTMTFGFADGSEQTLPTRIVVPHPFSPVVEHVFTGRHPSGQTTSVKVRIRRTATSPARVHDIQSTVPFIRGRMINDDEIEITVDPPQQSGRWIGILHIDFEDTTLPTVAIPVSGIVES